MSASASGADGAGPSSLVTPSTGPVPARQSGHNRISSQALTTLVCAAVAEIFGVIPAEVRVRLSDDSGQLAVSLATPIMAPGLAQVVRDRGAILAAGGSVWQRTVAAKEYVRARVARLSGSAVSRVDIRITAVQPIEDRKVR